MVNNTIHNNEGYGVVLVRSTVPSDVKDAPAERTKGIFLFLEETPKTSIPRFLECVIHNQAC